jgi:branched-chain amino acid transport system ATP-binding protein
MTVSNEAILETESLQKDFDGLTAVQNLNITVNHGEIVGLIGPNGAGKSTTFNLITGFLEPTAGYIYFNGKDITGESPNSVAKHGIGRTFQKTMPFGKLTVFENMLVPQTPGLSGQAKIDRVKTILDKFDLQHVAETNGEDLSGGQKKLLEVARILMLDPQLIMLDEPSAGVNPALMDNILDQIKRLNQEGHTIFVIEHDMTVISELCDSVLVMNNGESIAKGTFEEVQRDEGVRSAYLGT